MRRLLLLSSLFFITLFGLKAQIILNWTQPNGLGAFTTTGTVATTASGWGNEPGMTIATNSSVRWVQTGLAPGTYQIDIDMANQAATEFEAYEISTGASSAPLPTLATNGAYSVYTYMVTVPASGNATFVIERGANGFATQIRNWKITSLAPSNATDITGFSLPQQTAAATIDPAAHTVNITVPFSTNLTSLTPTIAVSTGGSISPASGIALDFSSPVNYTVTAEDGTTTQNWTVTVTRAAASTAKDILAFSVPEQTASATIAGTNITITVDQLADLTVLSPAFSLSPGATINAAPGVPLDFSSGSRTFTVTAEDGSTKTYTVNVNVTTVTTTPCSVKAP